MPIQSYTPNYFEPMVHPLAEEAAKHNMTVEKYLELLDKQQEGNGVVFSNTDSDNWNLYTAKTGGDQETNQKEQYRQAKGEVKAKENAAKAAMGILEMGMPSTYVGLTTGAAYKDSPHYNLWNESKLALDIALLGGTALARKGIQTALARKGIQTAGKKLVPRQINLSTSSKQIANELTDSDLKDISAKVSQAYKEHENKLLAEIIESNLGLKRFPTYEPLDPGVHVSLPYKSTADNALSVNSLLTNAENASGYIIGKMHAPKYSKYYLLEEMPRRLRKLKWDPTQKLLLYDNEGHEIITTGKQYLFQEGSLPVELFYSTDAPKGLAGYHSYITGVNRTRLTHKTPLLEISATNFHEGVMHGTDNFINDFTDGQVKRLYEQVAKDASTTHHLHSRKWQELRATLGETYRKLFQAVDKSYPEKDFDFVNSEVQKVIDKMSTKQLKSILASINEYGKDYALTMEYVPEYTDKLKWLLKNAPVAATPIVAGSQIIQQEKLGEKLGGKLNYLNYSK